MNNLNTAIELALDTNCQAMCIHCSPSYSDLYRNESDSLTQITENRVIKAFYRTRSKIAFTENSDVQNPEYWTNFWKNLTQLTEISLNGGEPLQSERTLKLIKDLSNHEHASKLTLKIFTSGMSIPDWFFEILEKFNQVIMTFSVDATGEQAEYLRWPIKWDSVVDNVKKSMSYSNVKIYFALSVHSLSLSCFPDIYKWIYSLNLNLDYNPLTFKYVHRPTWMDVRFVDQSTKEYINQLIWDFIGQSHNVLHQHLIDSLKGCLDFMWQHKERRQNVLLRNFIISMDKQRCTNFDIIFPELNKVI